MNDSMVYTFDEQCGYAVDERPLQRKTSERRGITTNRQLSGQERRSLKARYGQQSAPQRKSGMHRRRHKSICL